MRIHKTIAHNFAINFGFGLFRFYNFKTRLAGLNPVTGDLNLSNRLKFGALIFKPGSFSHRPWGSKLSQTFSVRNTMFGFSSSPLRGISENWILNRTRILSFIFQASPPFSLSKPIEAFVFASRLMAYSNTWFGGIAPVLGTTYYSFQPNWSIGLVETPCNQPKFSAAKPNQLNA